jgi:hypothetical protein
MPSDFYVFSIKNTRVCGIVGGMDNSKQDTCSVILHGHFYQPPRENPMTGIIPKQVSARPYEDWNERIFADCYSTNAHSRYLSPYRRVESITNNFSYISFNFGPTLLSWIAEMHPDIHEQVVLADRESQTRLGHGNAMAQAFNHTILPLDSPKDARLQILWGIEDFMYRFGRSPEGMWLPEAAINDTVVDLLAEAGIQFVILSPWQAAQVETAPNVWNDLGGKPAPYGKPYRLTGRTGREIAAFFYHPGLAEGISFGHALRDADALYSTLLSIKRTDGQPLIHAATDGEIYGHHEPFGDMALAALIQKVNARNDFELTNYATYLEAHPAVLHAKLHAGEAGLGTSWSCSHGVSRWWKDCGCHTGGEDGWNQAWRTPLRDSLRTLAAKIDAIFDHEVARIFNGSLTADRLLELYGPAICGKQSLERFLEELHADFEFDGNEDDALACLLEGIKNKHFSFTSCGWFFSDISGIEPRQNIKYALYTIDLYQKFTSEDLLTPFLNDLTKAKSNKRSEGSGMTIAKQEMQGFPGEVEAALFFTLNRRIARPEEFKSLYGRYRLNTIELRGSDTTVVDFLDRISLSGYSCTVLSDGHIPSELHLFIGVHDHTGTCIGKYSVTNVDIPLRMLDMIYSWIDRSLSKVTDNDLVAIAKDINNYSMLMKNSRYLPMETLYIENIGTCLRAIKSLFVTPNTLPWSQKRESIGQLIEFIQKKGRPAEIESVNRIFSAECDRVAEKIRDKGLDYEAGTYLIDLLEVARAQGIQPDITQLQTQVFRFLQPKAQELSATLMLKLCDALNFEHSILESR